MKNEHLVRELLKNGFKQYGNSYIKEYRCLIDKPFRLSYHTGSAGFYLNDNSISYNHFMVNMHYAEKEFNIYKP